MTNDFVDYLPSYTYPVKSTVDNLQYKVFLVQYMCIVDFTLNSLCCTMYTVHFSQYNIHCTLFTVHYKMYTVLCTVLDSVDSKRKLFLALMVANQQTTWVKQ